MQIIIDTATDTLADINLVTYVLEVLKARHGQPREEKQMDLGLQSPDWLPEMDKSLQLETAGLIFQAMGKLQEAIETPDPVTPQPADIHFTAHNTLDAPSSSVPDPVPSPPASDVAHLPAHLRNRLPEVPSLAVDEDTDAAGVKWDATLHSESRAKCADGTWRKRRTAKNVVTSSVVGVASAPETPTVEVIAPTLEQVRNGETSVVLDIPAPPVAAVPEVPSPPFVPVTTFRELMEQMTINMASRAVTSKDINAICHEHGIESLQMCFDNTALIPSVHTAIHKIAMKAGA